jgi:dihydroneopterin aldolase
MSGRITRTTVFARSIGVQAEIGIYPHERGRAQPLVVDIDVEIEAPKAGYEHISETVNYETLVEAARSAAADRHVLLVETYAEDVARACLAHPQARRVRVRVEKPEALAPQAHGAGVEIVVEKA